jgi:uncharacterized protein (TIGR00369 family)
MGDNMTAQRSDTVAEGWGASRSRVVTWHDPGPSTARGLTMAGLDYLQAMIDGWLPPPPICQLMRYDIVSAEPGRVVFTCEPDESAYNGIGVVHGGLVCTLLDSVAALALHSMLPQGRGYTSVEIKVNYLKAVRLGSGLLTATGTVVKAGSRIAFTEGVVSAASGAVVATASSTLAVFDL